jgi:hypothetical protein
MMTGVLAGVLLAGCGDGTEAGGALDEQEQAALTQALAQAGMLGLDGAAAFGALVGQATDIGSMGDYSALASQALITINVEGQPSESFVVSGVFGWTNLDAGSSTVGSAIALQALQEVADFPNTVESDVSGDLVARYFLGESNSTYIGTVGTFSATASGFGGFEDCPDVPDDTAFLEIVTCRYAFGSMEGDFAFEADRLAGTGPETFSQPATTFDLPAVRIEIEIDMTEFAPTAVGPSAR